MKIIVTGGSSGIGAAVVARSLSDGHEVVVLDITKAPDSATLLVDLSEPQRGRQRDSARTRRDRAGPLFGGEIWLAWIHREPRP